MGCPRAITELGERPLQCRGGKDSPEKGCDKEKNPLREKTRTLRNCVVAKVSTKIIRREGKASAKGRKKGFPTKETCEARKLKKEHRDFSSKSRISPASRKEKS